ncbi:MAG: glycosyltransferase [Porphyromonas sp.]|nr:glycosyltransferase [Porphyromonas sp.]
MNILIINTHLSGGGAAIAARRLRDAFSMMPEVSVAFLSLEKKSLRDRLNFVAERAEIFLYNGFRKEKIFHISTALWGRDISSHPLVKWADVIHLHWMNHGMISLKGLERLAKMGKPVFWTTHDMWPFTAVSPHLSDPNRYESPWTGKENSSLVQRVWDIKHRIYPLLRPSFICCTEWIAGKARESELTQGLEITTIPNTIDTSLFSPPTLFSTEQKRIVVGAVQTDDPRKGFNELLSALHRLPLREMNVVVDIFGNLSPKASALLESLPVVFHGYISSEKEMIELYRSAYMLVVPSLFENLPCTIMESLSCGTPVVAFETGGIPEMVQSGENGLLAKYADHADLADKIAEMLRLPHSQYQAMRRAAREKAVSCYSYERVAQQHIALYTSKLNGKP